MSLRPPPREAGESPRRIPMGEPAPPGIGTPAATPAVLLLAEAAMRLVRCPDPAALAQAAADAVCPLVGADRACVFFRDAQETSLVLRAWSGAGPPPVDAMPIEVDDDVIEDVFGTGVTSLVGLVILDEHVVALIAAQRSGREFIDVERASWSAFVSILESVTAGAILFDHVQSAREELELVSGASPDPMLHSLPDGSVAFANPAARHLARRVGGLEALTRLLDGAEELRLEDDSLFAIRSVLVADGGSVFVLRDVTESRRRDALLRQADKLAAMGTLLAQVAHEVGNPLTFVKGNTELAQNTVSDPEVRGFLDSSMEGIARIEKLVQGLKTLAKPGKSEHKRVSLASVVETTAAVVRPRFGRRIDLMLDLAPDVDVMGSYQDLGQVFLNLLLNASDATGDATGHILVSVRRVEGEVHATVRDSGPGIPDHVLANLFTPFLTTKENGTGLGLGICKDIIDAHGGRIEARNPDGGGAEFLIAIPSAEALRPARAPP